MREVAQIVPKMVKGSAKLAPRWANFVPKMANLVPLWRLPAPRSAPDANRSEVSGEVKAKMGPSWAKFRLVVSKAVQVRAKLAPRLLYFGTWAG